jgi:hypothetical protein
MRPRDRTGEEQRWEPNSHGCRTDFGLACVALLKPGPRNTDRDLYSIGLYTRDRRAPGNGGTVPSHGLQIHRDGPVISAYITHNTDFFYF